MRFGLLNLLIVVVFISGLLGCWLLRNPWIEWKKIPGKGKPIEDVAISCEHQYLVTREDQTEIKLYSFPKLKLLWEAPPASWIGLPNFHVSFSGNPTTAVHVFLVDYQSGQQQHQHFDLKTGDYAGGSEWVTDQARASTLRKSSPEAYRQSVFTHDGATYTFTPNLTLPWDEFAELEDHSDGTYPEYVWIYRMRFPPTWHGHFHRPEVWITILAGLALLAQFIRREKNTGSKLPVAHV